MKTFIVSLIAFFLSSVNLYSQHEFRDRTFQNNQFENDQRFEDARLGNIDEAMLDSIIVNKMQTNHIPGLQALIVKHDEIIWSKNYGYANIVLNHSVEDSTLFLMASVSKTILATAIMQFWEADSFDLDDNINDYLDDFQVTNPNHPNDTITIRMIMTHTSSIADNWENVLRPLETCGDSPIPLDTFLINYFTPGGNYYYAANFNSWSPASNTWDYCNVAVCILAYLVEKFSGVSFDQNE